MLVAGLSLAGVTSVFAVVLPMMLFAFAHGIHQPCGQAGLVGPFPDKAGTAASLSGFVMMLTASGIGLWLGLAPQDSILPMTLGVGVLGALLLLVAFTLVERDGIPNLQASISKGPP